MSAPSHKNRTALNPRQRELLTLRRGGMSNRQIADRYSVSQRAIDQQLQDAQDDEIAFRGIGVDPWR